MLSFIKEVYIKIIDDKEIAKSLLSNSKNAMIFLNFSDRLKDDEEIVKMAIGYNSFNLLYASERLQYDPYLIWMSIINNPLYILNLDFSKLKKVLTKDKFRHLKMEAENNFKELIKSNLYPPLTLAKLSSSVFGNNIKIMTEFIYQEPLTLQYASIDLRSNPLLVEFAIRTDGYAFNYANNNLKENYNFVKKCLSIDGTILAFVDKKFQKDIELCKIAIANNPNSIIYVNKTIRRFFE